MDDDAHLRLPPGSAPFDAVADVYARARREKPASLIDAAVAGVAAGARVLEIGCGTGQATVPLAQRGFDVTALELGPALAERARTACAAHRRVRVECAPFEEWDAAGRTFDLVIAVQSFHWIDREVGTQRLADLLPPGGRVSLLWSVDRSRGSAFWEATLPIYDRWFPEPDHGPPRPTLDDRIAAVGRALERHRAFELQPSPDLTWTETYDRQAYVDLLRTDSAVRSLPPEGRAGFVAEIGAVVDRHGGIVRRRRQSVLLRAVRR